MERLKFIGKRLIYLVVMLFGVATLVFILTKMIPGDPTVANLSQRALNDPEVVAASLSGQIRTGSAGLCTVYPVHQKSAASGSGYVYPYQ